MIAAARQHVESSPVSFEATSFEDFTAADRSFDLIISAAAFHWIDPEIKYAKAARLLRPGGWLAVLGNKEHYDDPFDASLHDMWIARGDDDNGAWVQQRASTETIAGTGLFDEPIQHTHTQRMARPVDNVIGIENTRAISLSWPDDVRHGFTEELRHSLRSQDQVQLTLQTTLTMPRVAPRVTTTYEPGSA